MRIKHACASKSGMRKQTHLPQPRSVAQIPAQKFDLPREVCSRRNRCTAHQGFSYNYGTNCTKSKICTLTGGYLNFILSHSRKCDVHSKCTHSHLYALSSLGNVLHLKPTGVPTSIHNDVWPKKLVFFSCTCLRDYLLLSVI